MTATEKFRYEYLLEVLAKKGTLGMTEIQKRDLAKLRVKQRLSTMGGYRVIDKDGTRGVFKSKSQAGRLGAIRGAYKGFTNPQKYAPGSNRFKAAINQSKEQKKYYRKFFDDIVDLENNAVNKQLGLK